MAIKSVSILILISIISFSICFIDIDLLQINENDANVNNFIGGNENRSENFNISTQIDNYLKNLTKNQQIKINYILNLLCLNKSDYRFYHIFVDEALETSIADEILKGLSDCVTAGLLTTM